MLESQYKEQQAKEKAYAKVYMFLCGILALSLIIYVYMRGSEYSAIKLAIDTNDSVIAQLQSNVSSQKANYESNKSEFDDISKEISDRLSTVFPDNDEYTNMTRQIDKLEEDLNRLTDPFEISNIDYLSVVEEDNYSILPFRMNIRASGDNFTKFLHKVENSGSLNDSLRLMDVSSIRISFQESEELGESSMMINFSVLINAYFQKI